MSRELLQQALDALEWYAECSVVAGKASDASNAIRAALAAPQGEAHELRIALHRISLASQCSMSSKEECGRIARNALHAVAPPAAPSVPDGWRLVPVEPTQEMCRAAVVYANGNAVYKNVAAEALQIEEGIYSEVYIAMLDAAPEAPSGEGA